MIRGATRRRFNPQQWAHRCATQKACFDTKAEALDVAEQMMQRGAVNPGCHITPYECPECGRWHVANKRIVFERAD